MTWPLANNKSQHLKLKIDLERFFKTIQSVEKQTEENSDRKKNFKAYYEKIKLIKPKFHVKDSLHLKNLKSLSKV